MEWNRIEKLVKKYWEGKTDAGEERELRQFFRTHAPQQLPASMRETAVLFRYFTAEEEKQPLGEAFDEGLLAKLHERTDQEAPWVRVVWINLLKLVACLAIVITLVLQFKNAHERAEAEKKLAAWGTYEDPQQAYQATKRALLLVSAQLNQGRAYTQEIKKISEAEAKVRDTPAERHELSNQKPYEKN